VYAGLLSFAGLLAFKGKNSKILQKISEFIVAPGNKLFSKNEKAKNFVNKYFCIDFNKSKTGKLVMSKGQLTTCVLVGGCGYFGASADRGKENLKETATRFPLVGLYVITGSELVQQGFKNYLFKKGKCKDVINNKKEVTPFEKLDELAKKLAKEKGTTAEQEFQSIIKQKGLIFGLPYLFSLLVMGFFVAGMTVRATKKRYEKKWLRLDNAALIYPSASNDKWTNVFRVSAYLKTDVKPEKLQQALNIVIERFPNLDVTLKHGIFWYYFENMTKFPLVEEEKSYPCAKMEINKKKHLFRVLYFKNKISFETFHALTDGNGAINFLNALIACYFELCGENLCQSPSSYLPYIYNSVCP
jgi:hypothetical protein